MQNALRFFVLTTATQLCLLANQVILLPLQIRAWGQDATAQWFFLLAIANIASVADLGARNAGHAQLFASVKDGDAGAAREFSSIWALTRALFVIVTIGLLAFPFVNPTRSFPSWFWVLTIAMSLDWILIVRGGWLDTLGHFNKVEGIYLSFIAVRISWSIVALVVFHASPATIAAIMLATALGACVAQTLCFPRLRSLAFLTGGFEGLNWRVLRLVRYAAAEPATNWVRLSLPVLVLGSISSPRTVTTFIAFRALFGMTRQVVSQFARYSSVSYVRFVKEDKARAEAIAVRSILFATWICLGVSGVVIADRGRLLSLWLSSGSPEFANRIAMAFVVGSLAYSYQIVAGVLIRSGDLVGVAKRQYAYLVVSGVTAAIALISNSVELYLYLLAFQELLIAAAFAAALGPRILNVSAMAFTVAACLAGALWLAADTDFAGIFVSKAFASVASSLAIAIMAAALFALAFFRAAKFGSLRRAGEAQDVR